jgi:hypothetical protein
MKLTASSIVFIITLTLSIILTAILPLLALIGIRINIGLFIGLIYLLIVIPFGYFIYDMTEDKRKRREKFYENSFHYPSAREKVRRKNNIPPFDS